MGPEPGLTEDATSPPRCPICYRELPEESGACAWCQPSSAPPPGPPDPGDLAGVHPSPSPDPPDGSVPVGVLLPPQPGQPQPKPFSELPRRVIWVLLIVLGWVYFAHGGGLEASVGTGQLETAGALRASLFDTFEQDWWRLVHASFVHKTVMLLMISAFLVWGVGGEVERRAGGGFVLLVFVGVGVVLNALRVGFEPAESLRSLAGGWPSGLALGGAGLVLAHRGNAAKVDGPPQPGPRMHFEKVDRDMIGAGMDDPFQPLHRFTMVLAGKPQHQIDRDTGDP